MPGPLAHVGLACAFLAASRAPGRPGVIRDAAWVAFAAVAADLDLVVDLVAGSGIHFHHGPTHSLVFALALGVGLGAWRPALRAPLLVAALLHAPLDWTTGAPGAPVKYGVTFFWPFSDQRFIAADPFFPPYHIDAPGGLGNLFVSAALPAWGREAVVVALAAVLAGAVRVSRTRGPAPGGTSARR